MATSLPGTAQCRQVRNCLTKGRLATKHFAYMLLQDAGIAIGSYPKSETIRLQPSDDAATPLVAGQQYEFGKGEKHHNPNARCRSEIFCRCLGLRRYSEPSASISRLTPSPLRITSKD